MTTTATTTTKQQAPAHAPQPTKQQLTLERLKLAWKQRGINIEAIDVKPDGKALLINVGKDWPIVKIGQGGGIDLLEVKSFSDAYEAAVNGDTVLAKQRDRQARKTTAASAPVSSKPEERKTVKSEPAHAQPAAEAVTPKAKKQRKQG